jgi:hypothetical protein
MGLDVKIKLDSFPSGIKSDSLFVNCFLSEMFEPIELIGRSISGKKNKAGEETSKIDEDRFKLLKGELFSLPRHIIFLDIFQNILNGGLQKRT